MTDMEKVKIHGVPETMLQTLFAGRPILRRRNINFMMRRL
mgnify:CR=1 FL=1